MESSRREPPSSLSPPVRNNTFWVSLPLRPYLQHVAGLFKVKTVREMWKWSGSEATSLEQPDANYLSSRGGVSHLMVTEFQQMLEKEIQLFHTLHFCLLVNRMYCFLLLFQASGSVWARPWPRWSFSSSSLLSCSTSPSKCRLG